MTTAILAATFVMATMAPPMDGPIESDRPDQGQRPKIARIFEKADFNNDGVIDQQEFAQAVRKLIDKRQAKGRRGPQADRGGRDGIGRGQGRRGDGMRGEGRRGQGRGNRRNMWCDDGPRGRCNDGPPMQGRGFGNRRGFDGPRSCDKPCGFDGQRGFNCPQACDGPCGFDGPRGKFGRHDRRGRCEDGCGPRMNRGQRGNQKRMLGEFPRGIERMIKNAVAEALADMHGRKPMADRDRGPKGKAGRGMRQMKRDCDKGMMPFACDPAQCGDQVRQRDGFGRGEKRGGQRGARGPRGDRAERFQRLDTNGDGVLTLDEFNAGPNRDGVGKPKGDGPGKDKRPQRGQGRRGGRGPAPQANESL